MYRFTPRTVTDDILLHASHNWEEWHAYLAFDLPADIPGEAGGICCHDCRLIVWEV